MKHLVLSSILTRKFIFSTAALGLLVAGLLFGAELNKTEATSAAANTSPAKERNSDSLAPAATFPGTGVGAIPDGPGPGAQVPGVPLDISFAATGISGAPTNVEVSITLTHTWVGDLKATLIAPNGVSFVVFGYTGATTPTSFGTNSDLAGTYNFRDSAAGTNWWTAALTSPFPVGNYRTTVSGPTTSPAALTNLTAAFSGIPTSNGTWILRITDGGNTDLGSVSAASLTIVGAAAPLDANADFNGDGKTDFIMARATNAPFSDEVANGKTEIKPQFIADQEEKGRRRHLATDPNAVPLAPQIYWYTSINGAGTTSVQPWGDAATDFVLTEDFDGDGKDDLTVWREAPATQAAFYIFQSQTNTFKLQVFGQTNDDPAVVGDYDGDGKADPAVYRCPAIATPAGQCFFFYRGSLANPGGNVTYVPWGFGNDGDNFPYVGDFDGDGKNDFGIQRSLAGAPTQGQFVLLKSGGGVEYINWGLNSDFLIPGDYDGDGKTDLCVRRTVSGTRQHFILTRTGVQSQIQWGITGDVSAPGDYDGDGKTDLAVWRSNVDPLQNFFWVRNSNSGSVTQFEWGQANDFPVAGWVVH